ncbi:phospholipase D family protein [Mesorhizobium sp. L48C026A00]|uniref:phospholipase D family protein n=1 Tax=Mesorhizobium sp. L48C026A00 TaxID=1287182 RepID=UPI0003D01649|nr:phospholipase D family protein [Mesorhizobium sp. L48C026A00]ESZ20979.1 hypothetical protein X737_08620 [Mesorhizobium sp. L48C026A00]
MTKFLLGVDLTRVIRSILAESGSKSAVAFWGRGSEDWVTGPDSKVVANLGMGGTNPYALRKVRAEIKQCDTLHAKVYIGRKHAVVASANASINGLALEGSEQEGWIEAGVLIERTAEIRTWFDMLWDEHSKPITEPQWKEAERRWNLRVGSFKPSVTSFAEFDTEAPSLPIVTFIRGDEDWIVNERAVESATGAVGPVAHRRVEEGVWVLHKDDRPVLRNRWVLEWQMLASGRQASGAPGF